MKKIFFLIFAAIFSVGLSSTSFAKTYDVSPYGGGDHLPWPWGTECPFPWSDIQGVWVAKAAGDIGDSEVVVKTYYQFKILSEWKDGTKVFEVSKFNEDGVLVGEGKGYSPSDQKIVRAVVLSVNKSAMANHRVIVRAYTEAATQACGNNLITVLTTRAMNGDRSQDNHYILNKLNPDTRDITK